ncbi:MAG: hypothetical protein H7196_01975 [candidate division SR1 bacterium]|nr:hypothetical protein [candidate division SR1 bacterium]
MHDSFSSQLNHYVEQEEYVIGKNKFQNYERIPKNNTNLQLFDDNKWKTNVLTKIEHPQYSRPEIWNNLQVPEILLSGNHKKIQNWRLNWWK